MMRTTAAFRDIAVVVGVLALGMACGPQAGEGALHGDPQDSTESAARKGGGSGGGDTTPVVTPSTASVVLAFATSAPGDVFVPVSSVSLDAVPTVYVVADWKDLSGEATEQLEIVTPSGTLYAGLEIPIASSTRGDVQYRVLADGTRRVVYLLRLWGTAIERQRRTGQWTATVQLKGGTAAATSSFMLQ